MPLQKCRLGKPMYSKKDAETIVNDRFVGSKQLGFRRGRLLIKRRNKQQSAVLRAYHCPECNCWHVTHLQTFYKKD